MAIENARIKTLDQELMNLKKAVDRMYQLTNTERLSYQMIESQFSMLKDRNAALEKENLAVQQKITDSLAAAELIIEKAKKEEADIKANAMILYSKANSRYKQLTDKFDHADKQIRETLRRANVTSDSMTQHQFVGVATVEALLLVAKLLWSIQSAFYPISVKEQG